MKRIVTYKLHNGRVPYFIEDGGYWIDPTKPHEMVGITADDDCCFVPMTTLVELTAPQLVTKVSAYTMHDFENNELTTAEKETMINSWLADKGFI